MQLKDKVAVVTGGGRGIGRAIALAFAGEGADVVVTARTTKEIENVAEEIKGLGRKSLAITTDLSQRKAVSSLRDQVLSQFPTIHILVNNAGIGSGQNPKLVMEYDDEFWDMTLMVNLTVPYLLTKDFLPTMVKQGWGRIINISSVAGKSGFLFGAAYSTSKHGLIGLTRTVALEVATEGITVNAICPGPIRTSMLAKRMQVESEHRGISLEEVEKSFNPIQRLLEPEEVAAMAVYLASEKAQAVTGQSFNISGGSTMH
jgi:NAD(P)-dependent dehydrogenase (short-subunit alcohol dehydrogenase family)